MQLNHPPQNSASSAIALNPNKKRIETIFQSFLSEADKIEYLNRPGIRILGPNLDRKELEIALKTGNKTPHNKAVKYLKKEILALQFKYYCKKIDENPNAILVVWNGQKGHRRLFSAAARRKKRRIFFFEEAPLPDRIAIDPGGVNYGSSLPKNISFYRQWLNSNHEHAIDLTTFQYNLRSRISNNRADITQNDSNENLKNKNYIFCPLQAPGDSQLTIFGDWVTSVQEHIAVLLRAAQMLPKGWHLRVKEHPSAKVSFTKTIRKNESEVFRLDNKTDTLQQVKHSSGVMTVNSSVGLQSFFFNKPVIVLGQATFGLPEIATRASNMSAVESVCSNPDSLTFNYSDRQAFISYIIKNCYPLERCVIEGHIKPSIVLSQPHLQVRD